MDALSDILINILIRIEWASILYFLVVNSLYGVLLLSACAQLRTHLLASRGEISPGY